MAIPEWAKQMRRKNTEVREIKGKYYLYEVHCKYNKETKTSKKIKPVYLGRLVEGKGLIEKGTANQQKITPSLNVEYGISATAEILMDNQIAALKKYFPEYWKTLLAAAYCRLVYHSPLEDMDQHWVRSYLSAIFPDTNVSPDSISESIRQCGADRDAIDQYFGEFKSTGEVIAFENEELVFSAGQNKPVFYRNPCRFTCLKQYGGVIFIAGEDFYSSGNVEMLDGFGLDYIIPLKRGNSGIDYTPASFQNLCEGGETFRYNGNTIYVYTKELDDNHNVILCVDTNERDLEAQTFRENELRPQMGTIAFLTSKKISLSGSDIYKLYKKRAIIGEQIDAFNTGSEDVLDSDSREGWKFVNFIALQWYYEILNKLDSSYSVESVVNLLKDVRKVQLNGKWYSDPLTAEEAQVVDALGIKL